LKILAVTFGPLTFHLGEVLLHFPCARFAVQGYLQNNHLVIKIPNVQTPQV
jgi:hypothetical protein